MRPPRHGALRTGGLDRPQARYLLEAGLVGVTVVWGATFVLVKDAVERVPPLSFNTARFLLAAAVLGIAAFPALRRLSPAGWRHGTVLGMLLFGGYAFQTVGLQYTEASTAGFITGMFVVFTPLLSAVLLRRVPIASAWIGVTLATVGLALLSLRGSFVPSLGDVLILLCAVSFAGHIVGLGAWSQRHDPLPLTVVQLTVAALLHALLAGAFESPFTGASWDRNVVVAVVVTAVLASAAAFWVQTAAQQVVPPTRTAIVLTMEPVFAGLFGFWWLGERLALPGWVGCALILAGMLVAEVGAARRRAARQSSAYTSTSLSAASE